MLENAIIEFNKYTKNFDLSISPINSKYYHTFRVVDYAKQILESLDADEYIIELGCVAALLHDIARFEQYTKYGTFKDSVSCDHGKRGYEILKQNDYILKYVKKEEQEIILNAVLKHNQKDLELTGNNLEDVIAKVVRDADKLDIMMIFGNQIKDPNYQINKKLLKDILNCRSCDYKNIVCSDDHILGILGFIFDVNFKETFKIIRDSGIIEKKIMVLKKYDRDFCVDLIEEVIDQYIDKKIGDDEYVRN